MSTINSVHPSSLINPGNEKTLPQSFGFVDVFDQMLSNVNQDQHEANIAIKNLLAGKTKNIHETMLILERADMSLKFAMQVRNKVLDAYKEIMKMPV